MEQKSKIAVYLSTDGKLTVEYHADTWVEEAIMYPQAAARFGLLVALMNQYDLKKKGFNGPWKGGGGATKSAPAAPPVVPNRVCPQCGSKLVFIKTQTGKRMLKCSTAKWDKATKTASGCNFIEWINDGEPDPVLEAVDPKLAQFDRDAAAVAAGHPLPTNTASPDGQNLPFDPATPSQRRIIMELYPTLWKDNMQFAEAQKIIVENSSK